MKKEKGMNTYRINESLNEVTGSLFSCLPVNESQRRIAYACMHFFFFSMVDAETSEHIINLLCRMVETLENRVFIFDYNMFEASFHKI